MIRLGAVRTALLVATTLTACGTDIGLHAGDYLGYAWDDRRVLCSDGVDDLPHPVNWPFIEDQLRLAHDGHYVLALHAHVPTMTVTLDALDHVFTVADQYNLDYVTFRELEPSSGKRAGLAFAFDDNSPDQWMLARELLARHHARVTFFVSRFDQMTPLGHQELAILDADGHDLEPHTVNHLHAPDYVAHNGIDAYLRDEVLPSFKALEDAGYPPARAFAYPFGEHTPELDDALLQVVDKVRTTPGGCPW